MKKAMKVACIVARVVIAIVCFCFILSEDTPGGYYESHMWIFLLHKAFAAGVFVLAMLGWDNTVELVSMWIEDMIEN